MGNMEVLKARIAAKGDEIKSLTQALVLAREAYDSINELLKQAIEENSKLVEEALAASEA